MSVQLLAQAIQQQCAVEFEYDGHRRVVHPAAVGLHRSTNRESLRGYQVGGTSASRTTPLWDLFTVAKIQGLRVLGGPVPVPPGFSPGDKHMSVIYAER